MDQAPIIYFDGIRTLGTHAGLGHLELVATVFVAKEQGTKPTPAPVGVAHLRFPLRLLPALKQAIEQVELASTPLRNARAS